MPNTAKAMVEGSGMMGRLCKPPSYPPMRAGGFGGGGGGNHKSKVAFGAVEQCPVEKKSKFNVDGLAGVAFHNNVHRENISSLDSRTCPKGTFSQHARPITGPQLYFHIPQSSRSHSRSLKIKWGIEKANHSVYEDKLSLPVRVWNRVSEHRQNDPERFFHGFKG